MDKQALLDYANNMEDDEEVFAIIYSKADVSQWFRDESHKTLVPPDDDIYSALSGWEDNMDLSCSVNLADAFTDICDVLLDNEKKRTQ